MRYNLISWSTVKDLQLADRTQRLPAQVAGIQRVTIENDYLHGRHTSPSI
jgi:hypothetical protein